MSTSQQPTPEEAKKWAEIERKARDESIEVDNDMGKEDFDELIKRASNKED